MYVIRNLEDQRHPIKVWLPEGAIEPGCLEQTANLSRLPFIHQWVALMPDTHQGMGMPIGGVIATEGVIIPNAVGVDIGCGMAFVQTDIPAEALKEAQTPSGSLLQCLVGDILRNVPVGSAHHPKPQPSRVIDEAIANVEQYACVPSLVAEIENGYYQIGTLGGGNHFIEIQQDEAGMVCVMLHSGSRHFGLKICNHFDQAAQELNQRWYSSVPEEYRLAFLPVDTDEGQNYIRYMNLALDFAHENRDRMMQTVQGILARWSAKLLGLTPAFSGYINCHHNYAAIEHHYGKDVWVHRKGAIRAREGEIGIIPGAMGSASYIVEGKGNPESFYSCSHGAGRRYSRTKAMENFSVEQVMVDLKTTGVVLGKHKKNDVPEECRFAYKDIEEVIANELDLVTPVKKLSTLGVVKG